MKQNQYISVGFRGFNRGLLIAVMASTLVLSFSRHSAAQKKGGMTEPPSEPAPAPDVPTSASQVSNPPHAVDLGQAASVTLKTDEQTAFYFGHGDHRAFICIGGCTLHLAPGRYDLSLRRGLAEPVSTNPLEVISGSSTVYGVYASGHSSAGTVVGAVGGSLGGLAILSGITVALSPDASTADETLGAELALGGALFATISILVGVALQTEDKAELFTGKFDF